MKTNTASIIILLTTLCYSSLLIAQKSNETKIADVASSLPFIISDSLPLLFEIDISTFVRVSPLGAFNSFKKDGRFNQGQVQFNGDYVKQSFIRPVNELTLSFNLQNTSSTEKLIYFEFGKPDLIELINLEDSSKKIISGGFLGKSNRITSFTPNKYIPILIRPKSINRILLYLKFMGTYKETLTPKILSEKSFQLNSIYEIDKTRLQLIYHSFIMGGIFIISVFMFAQFFLNKDKAYLQYAAYGVSIFLLSEKIMELNCNINLISYFFPYYVYYSHIILQLLVSLFYIGFLKKLLEISPKEKAIYTYSNIMQKLLLLGSVLYFVTFFIPDGSLLISVIYNYGAFVSTIAMFPFLVLLLLLKRKDAAVRLVTTGFSIVVICTLAVVYINRSGLYRQFSLLAPISILEFGVFLEMIFFGLALGYKSYKQKLEKESIALQKNEMEMAALKAQMNPHFMFNCINSIDSFIQTNDKYNATLYLNKFAKLIRNVLDSSKQNVVSFSKDIETLRLYIELEELRSDNKFKTNLVISDELMDDDYKVPPLIIQPFVENAIIHGLKNREDNNGLLFINILKQNNRIYYVISDNGIGRRAASQIIQNKETHFGMQMSYDRIKLFNKEANPSVVVTDLYEGEKATGTKIEVYLNIM